MITTLTYAKDGEQLTLTQEWSPLGELLSQDLKGNAAFRKALEALLAKASRHYDGMMTTCQYASETLSLHLAREHDGDPPAWSDEVILD